MGALVVGNPMSLDIVSGVIAEIRTHQVANGAYQSSNKLLVLVKTMKILNKIEDQEKIFLRESRCHSNRRVELKSPA